MKRKKLLIAVLAIALLVGTVSALIPYFGRIITTAEVDQAVLVDGKRYADMPIEDTITGAGGESFCKPHWLENYADVPVPVVIDPEIIPDDGGVKAACFRPLGYKFAGSSFVKEGSEAYGPIDITVEDGDCAVTWTFDMIGDRVLEGDGHWAYGIAISFDGETPNFLVHDNDGIDPSFLWGTHLVSYYHDGWHVFDENIPVDDLSWVECTGDRYIATNPDGIFSVTINKCMLDEAFYWGAWFGMGGFYGPYSYGLSAYPEAFDWEFGELSEHAELMEPIDEGVMLLPSERFDFIICYWFRPDAAGTYTVTTTVKLVE